MCFTLYIGSNITLPEIPWDIDHPAFNTKMEMEDWEMKVPDYINYPQIIYAGSHEGCGCGFRHALIEGERWLPVMPAPKIPRFGLPAPSLLSTLHFIIAGSSGIQKHHPCRHSSSSTHKTSSPPKANAPSPVSARPS